VQNANLQFTAKADSFAAASVKGSPAQDDLNVFSQQTKDVDAAMSALGKLYTETKDKAVKDSLNKVYDQYDSVIQSYVPGFVNAHPHSYASAYIISRTLLINPKVEVLELVYNSLDSIVKVSKFGKVVVDVLGAAHKTAVGQVAPDFTMNDRDGKPVALSSLRGKYIFLDFWASWCGPCRRENPNIVEAYAKFHSAKFDILGVSLDSEKDNWEMAIKKDKLTWQHVSDLKGWGNAAAKMYGIRAIPANLLLDKEGKILARNLYGSDLEKKLKEVLK
jgi:peroxiredoxin